MNHHFKVRRYEQPAFSTWKFNSYRENKYLFVKILGNRGELLQFLWTLVKSYLGRGDEFTKELKQLLASVIRGT